MLKELVNELTTAYDAIDGKTLTRREAISLLAEVTDNYSLIAFIVGCKDANVKETLHPRPAKEGANVKTPSTIAF